MAGVHAPGLGFSVFESYPSPEDERSPESMSLVTRDTVSRVRRADLSSWWAWPLLGVITLAAGSAAFAQPALNDGPLIRFAERRVEFGDVSETTPVSHSFPFWNDGTEPLLVTKVESQCGCTAAVPTDSLLFPGDESAVAVTFDGRDLSGPTTKVVVIYTNDPAEPRVDLVLTANVIPMIRFTEQRLDFEMVSLGQTPVRSTLITADADLGFEIERFDGGEDRVDWNVIPASSSDGDAYRIEAKIKPDAPLGEFNQKILVFLEHPEKEFVRMGIKGTIYSCFVADEPGIRFGSVGIDTKVSRKLSIRNVSGDPYRITSAEAVSEYIRPSVDPSEDGYVLTVEVDGRLSGVGPGDRLPFREYIHLRTTDPAQEDLVVQVRGAIRG